MNHDKMANISAKRGFLWPSFEIYSGVSGFTDYGPLGASLKNNIMQGYEHLMASVKALEGVEFDKFDKFKSPDFEAEVKQDFVDSCLLPGEEKKEDILALGKEM